MNLQRIQAFLYFAGRQGSVSQYQTRRRLIPHSDGDTAPYTLWTVDLATLLGELRVSFGDPFDVSRFGGREGERTFANLMIPADTLAKEMLFDFRGAAADVLNVLETAKARAESEALISLANSSV